MAELKFDEDLQWQKQNAYWDEAESMPILVRLVMKMGVGRRAAYYVLFGILVICSFATFEIIRQTFFPSNTSEPTYIEDIPPEILKTLPDDLLKSLPSRNATKK